MANKDFSQSSNPYYENAESPLIHAPRDDLKLLKIKAQKNRKKKSSKNVAKKLSENSRDRIKSDRSQGAKQNENVVHLEINAEDNTLDEKDDNASYQKEKDIDTPLENTMTPTKPQDPENEQVSSTSDLKSSEHLDYLEDVDSPISTDSNIDNFFDFEEGF